jgi:kynurenine formamidase
VASFEELLRTLKTWGQWGPDDERGTLNYITPVTRRAAAGLVRQGKTFSLAIPICHGAGPQRGGGRINPLHLMTATGCDPTTRVDLGKNTRYVDDVLVMMVQGGTQWDALCHVYYDDHLYNGFAATQIDSRGAHRGGIDKVHADFVSRGVLLDVARWKGVDCLPAGYAITTADLEATEAHQGVTAGEGDILLVRTGQMSTVDGFAEWGVFHGKEAGLHWETASWLHSRRIAAVAADNSMVEATAQLPGVRVPFHMLALCNLGLHLGEFWYLEELATDCSADGVWDCMLVAQALPITGGSGSPVNPLALK